MAKKVYISPSNQKDNSYSAGNTNEMVQCNKIAEAVAKALKTYGIESKKAPQGQNMWTSINESNAYKPDIHLCIHTNAGGGKGTEVFVYSSANKSKAQPVYDELVKLTGNGRGIKTAEFSEITNTSATCVYCECEFHDNAERAKWIIANTTKLGEAIAKGLAQTLGAKKQTTTTTKKPTTTSSFKSYKVRVTPGVGLNIRKGAGTNYEVVGCIAQGGVYTIVAESSGTGANKWGKLKSGAGWIALDYTEKI